MLSKGPLRSPPACPPRTCNALASMWRCSSASVSGASGSAALAALAAPAAAAAHAARRPRALDAAAMQWGTVGCHRGPPTGLPRPGSGVPSDLIPRRPRNGAARCGLANEWGPGSAGMAPAPRGPASRARAARGRQRLRGARRARCHPRPAAFQAAWLDERAGCARSTELLVQGGRPAAPAARTRGLGQTPVRAPPPLVSARAGA
jgi:hypothetical protein